MRRRTEALPSVPAAVRAIPRAPAAAVEAGKQKRLAEQGKLGSRWKGSTPTSTEARVRP